MLSNAYFLAKFRFDTAENEPAKHLAKFANFANPSPLSTQRTSGAAAGPGVRGSGRAPPRRRPARRPGRSGARGGPPPTARTARWGEGGRAGDARDEAKLANFSKILNFFGGLVLGCIKTKFCKKICV